MMLATPDELVVAAPPLGNVALAPVCGGAVKFTVTLLSGCPALSVTVA